MTMSGNEIPMMESVFLGIVQGATEFLPVSSSAHLRVAPALMSLWNPSFHDPGAAYTAVIQLGSVLAVLTYFFKDLLGIATGSLKAIQEKDYANADFRMAGAIMIGTVPVCVLGLALKHIIEADNSPLRSLSVVGISSIVMGLLLFAAEKLAKHTKTIAQVVGKDGFLVGCGQAMALIPGCSRSGSTLTVALFLGYKREEAARFSFLLGIPAIVLSGLLELYEMIKKHALEGAAMSSLLIGLVVTTVVSYAAIWWMLRYLKTHSTVVFVIYRLLFGAGILYMVSNNILH